MTGMRSSKGRMDVVLCLMLHDRRMLVGLMMIRRSMSLLIVGIVVM